MDSESRIGEFLSGRMSPRERAAFVNDLTNDPELAAELRRTKRTIALLRAVPTTPPPADLTANIMASVRAQAAEKAEPARLPRLRRRVVGGYARRFALVAGVAGMLVLVGGEALNLRDRNAQTDSQTASNLAVNAARPASSSTAPQNVRLAGDDEQFLREAVADYQQAAYTTQSAHESTESHGGAAQ